MMPHIHHVLWTQARDSAGFPGDASGKESACNAGDVMKCGFDPWVGKILWRRAWQPTPVSLPGESHGQRSLVGYSPWGHKESDMTEALMQESWQLEQRQGNTSLNQMTPGWHVRGHGWKAKGHLRKSRGKREGERPPLALLAGKKHVFRRAVPLTSYGWW